MHKETNQDNVFEYNYSAKQQKEIETIRRKYMQTPRETKEDKMETLRRLDQSTERKGTIWGLVFGIVGILLFGTGMSCVMVWPDTLMAMGIVTGIVGIMLIVPAYPIYRRITRKEREKLAPRILALTEELMNDK